MEVVKIGIQNDAVKTLQTYLRQLKYDIIIDGHFGDKTEDAVIDFQRKNNLTADGIVGKMTWNKLVIATKVDDVQVANNMRVINDTKYILPTKNYYQEVTKKTDIVLHHTAGWVVKRNSPTNEASMTHFDWWKTTNVHVSTPYSVDYYGNIYEHFDPKFWAYHLGIGGKLKYLDQRSIGIEITNEGPLKLVDGKYYWLDKIPYIRNTNGLTDEPVELANSWRGHKYFAPYSQAQIDATLWLVKHLCDRFGIEKNMIADNVFHQEILLNKFRGIYNHSNVRTDKTDLSPAFPLEEFKSKL